MSTEAAIQKGKGLISNPAFFMIFALCAALLGAGFFTMLLSWLDYCGALEEGCGGVAAGGFQGIRFFAIGLVGVVAVLFAIAWFTGLKENLFIGLIVVMGFLSGCLADYLVFHVWVVEHDSIVLGMFLVVVFAVLPPTVLVLERFGILPLFVAFGAAIWGVISVIVFVYVVFIGTDALDPPRPAARDTGAETAP